LINLIIAFFKCKSGFAFFSSLLISTLIISFSFSSSGLSRSGGGTNNVN